MFSGFGFKVEGSRLRVLFAGGESLGLRVFSVCCFRCRV